MSFGRVVAFLMLAAAVVGAGCTKANPLDCSNGTCSDPAHPYCDKDGTVDGQPNTCIKPACSTPNEFVECAGSAAVSCNATEDGYNFMQCPMGCSDAAHGCNMCTPNGTYCTAEGVQSCGSDGAPTTFESCAAGCVDSPQPHCAHLVPRYLANICDTGATGDVALPNGTLGTDLDTSCTGGVVMQTAAPDICVVRGKTITIDAGATLKATGGRLLALVADDSLTIHGMLDASADGTVSGPGGGTATSGGPRAAKQGPGGGGAGFKTAGAAGASQTADGGAANGGPAVQDPALLGVMEGGPKSPDAGGGGGVILIACRGSVVIDGMIDLGGGGGPVGANPTGLNPINGGGGGAGGYLVAQGWNVSITGKAFANGGGGGAGYSNPGGTSGQDGSIYSTQCAAGGTTAYVGAGGAGGCKASAAGVGKFSPGGTTLGGAGGGGGGMGYLQTYTPVGVAPTLTPTDCSPDFQDNLNVKTQ